MVPSSFKSSALGAFAFFAQLLMAAPANADFDRLAPRRLRLSAVVSSAPPDDTAARIECWEFATPFRSYPTVGEAIALANTTNATYVVLPARSKEGLHHPPHPMLFVLLSGLAHVTLPHGSSSPEDELWISEGEGSLIVAADIAGEGHFTDYPSEKSSLALQLPFTGGIVPQHTVLHRGPCPSDAKRLPDFERREL